VGAWTLPVAAAAFAVGLVAWPAMPAWVEPWMPLGVGVVALMIAWLGAGRHVGGADALVGAGLLPPDPVAVAALAPGRTDARAPLGAAVFAVVGMLALGVGWAGFRDRARDTALLARLAPERVTVEGTLKTDPGTSTFGWSAEVYVRTVTWRDGAVTVRSSIWASGDGSRPRARRGDRVSLEGVVRVPDDPGFAEALRHKGIPAQLQVDSFTRSGGSANVFVRATQATRQAVGRSITRVFPPREAGLLLGLVLGDDSELEPGMERDFRAAGLSHLLVVSGENVAMILAPVLAAVALLRLSRWPRFVVGFGTVAFFTVLTGAEPSVLRAGVMAGLALIGVLMGRPRAIASILSAAVLALLVLDPWLIWSVGFQLSVAATAGMVSVASPMAAWWARVAPKPLAIAAGASMAAQLGVTPILLTHFGEVPLVTLPANLLAFPLVAPALLLGVLASALGLVWLPMGLAIGALARLPMRGLELIADRLGKAPVGYLTSQEGPFVLIVGSIVVIGLVVWIRTRWRPPRAVIVVAVAALPLLVWASALAAGPPSGLMVRFFDVGQGDAALLTTPEGATVLFDGGPDEEQVARELAAVGVRRLDLVVASHPHADHIIGLPAVLTRVPVGLLLQPGCPDASPLQADLDRAIADEHVPVRTPRAGAVFWLGSLRLDILSPDRCWVGTESDTNNDAIVVRASYLGHVVLIASEPEEPAQEVLLESGVDLHADVLKVPHHGAATSIPEFFDAVGAAVAVVSVGADAYGHPVPAALDAILASGAEVWRTDRAGTITIRFAGRTPTIESERWPAAALP
jgi:competence protein ComEC